MGMCLYFFGHLLKLFSTSFHSMIFFMYFKKKLFVFVGCHAHPCNISLVDIDIDSICIFKNLFLQ